MKILYIEDSPSNRLLVRRVLIAEGYEVLEAGDGSIRILSSWISTSRMWMAMS